MSLTRPMYLLESLSLGKDSSSLLVQDYRLADALACFSVLKNLRDVVSQLKMCKIYFATSSYFLPKGWAVASNLLGLESGRQSHRRLTSNKENHTSSTATKQHIFLELKFPFTLTILFCRDSQTEFLLCSLKS